MCRRAEGRDVRVAAPHRTAAGDGDVHPFVVSVVRYLIRFHRMVCSRTNIARTVVAPAECAIQGADRQARRDGGEILDLTSGSNDGKRPIRSLRLLPSRNGLNARLDLNLFDGRTRDTQDFAISAVSQVSLRHAANTAAHAKSSHDLTPFPSSRGKRVRQAL